MAEKRVSVRLGVIGGKEVEATFVDLGNRGSAAMQRLGNESEQAFTKVNTAARSGSSGLQNVGFQIQDFAVQVGAGTSATQALAQQLPQLLSGFGLLGVVLGTASAILIPIAGYFFSAGEEAETATDKVDRLTDAVGRLQDINATFDVAGIDKLIAKYGELDAAVVLLMNRQRELAEREAITAARDAGAGFAPAFEDALEYLRQYEEGLNRIANNPGIDQAAAQVEALAIANEAVTEEFGLTIDQIQQMEAALQAMAGADSVAEMADATATLTGLLEGSSIATTELEGNLLAAEDALRQLNAEGDGIGGWLGAAIDWAGSLGARLWDAAAAAAAVRAAEVKNAPVIGGGRGTSMGGPALDPYGFRAQLKADEAAGAAAAKRASGGGRRGGGGGGGGGGGARSETNELEKEAERIFKATRTEAEKYAAELAKLEKIKAAGLITNDTYNRQIEALGEQFGAQGNMIDQIREKLADFAKEAGNIGDDIGDALVNAFDAGADAVAEFVKTGKLDFSSLVTNFIADLARLAAQKFIFGPLAKLFEGFLGGLGGGGGLLAGILHEGGIAGSGGGRRTVDPSVFAGARRYHSGGLAGDEVPAILQRGERVLSKQETRAYDRGGAPTIVFNVKDAASVRQSRSQIAADASRALSMGRRGQ